MHEAARNVIRQRMERTAQALRKNNMEAVSYTHLTLPTIA